MTHHKVGEGVISRFSLPGFEPHVIRLSCLGSECNCSENGIQYNFCLTESSLKCLFKPSDYVMHHQFNIQQLYALPTLYLCVLHLSENKQRLVPLTA